MTTKEFSDSFDVLLNSHSASIEFGEQTGKSTIVLDEYEKSVFLTKAQEELIIDFYSGRHSSGNSFEETEEIRRYLSSLLKTSLPKQSNSPIGAISEDSYFFQLPEDLWFITYEAVKFSGESSECRNGVTIEVRPVTQDTYHSIKNNPFRGANSRRVLRLDYDSNIVELISKYNIDEYLVKYIAKPSPIILEDLPQGLSINGESSETQCSLHSSLHKSIVDRAVAMAIASKATTK